MPHQIERSDEEIDAVLNKASEQADKGGSQWPGMTYEDGVAAAINWMIGHNDDNPMDD